MQKAVVVKIEKVTVVVEKVEFYGKGSSKHTSPHRRAIWVPLVASEKGFPATQAHREDSDKADRNLWFHSTSGGTLSCRKRLTPLWLSKERTDDAPIEGEGG
ncbi:unnamed protein product [Gadus morhua 'NCC']